APIRIGSPSAAERAEIDGSPGEGRVTTPPLAAFAYRRKRLPPAQRRPSPKNTGGLALLPCRSVLSAFGSSLEQVSCTVSPERLAAPDAERTEPPVAAEFSQPRPAAPLLPHGQAAPLPSP